MIHWKNRSVHPNGGDLMTDREMSPDMCHALVLNADYRPLSYFPLSVIPWQDAIQAMMRDHVTVLSEYATEVHSPSTTFKLPSVLVLKEYVPNKKWAAFTRLNVFLRDHFACQYCGKRYKTHELTFDHVIPRSRGGRTTWDNIVTACHDCNLKKGNKLPHEIRMYPGTQPMQPSLLMLQKASRKVNPSRFHESWRDYLYWDSELEETI